MMELPTVSGFVFYLSNLVIVSGYLAAALVIIRRKGNAKDMSWTSWVAGIAFFLLCGLTHVELALHAYFGDTLIGTDGSVSWHMLAIHIPQGLSIWAFLWALQRDNDRRLVIPLEGAAVVDPEVER